MKTVAGIIKIGSITNQLFGSLKSPFGYVPLEKVRLAAGRQLAKRYRR